MGVKKKLRSGFTTGASVTGAAVAAAALLFKGEKRRRVTIHNLEGQPIDIPISEVRLEGEGAMALVIKDAGDDPDVTNGLEFVVQINKIEHGIKIIGGEGVGKVTKPGLQIPVGEPAINPVPRKMICENVQGLIPDDIGLEITIIVPRGAEAAKKTLNGKLGIIGGISILGTSGIVHPMSEEAFKTSLVPQIHLAKAHGFRTIVLTPGRIGEKIAQEKFNVPENAIVQMSNFVGFMLNACAENGIKEVILLGHHSKLVKVAAGCFYTHSKICDARLETIAAYAALAGAEKSVIENIMGAVTAEGVVPILEEKNLLYIFNEMADKVTERASAYVYNEMKIGTVMVTMDGNIIGKDNNAVTIGRSMGWQI